MDGAKADAESDSAAEVVVPWLRQALRHLYDPPGLRTNPLFDLLQPEGEGSPAGLRGILVDSIEGLRPDRGMSHQSNAWRTYHVLVHRYVEQFSQSEVATSLNISVRQLRRQERYALQVLADYLISQRELRPKVVRRAQASAEPGPDSDVPANGQAVSRGHELELLEKSLTDEPTDAGSMILAVLETIDPLLQAAGVRAECRLAEVLPRLRVPKPAMRQALLTGLSVAIRSVPGGQVTVSAEAQPHQVSICISARARPPLAARSGARNRNDELRMTRQLVGLCGGAVRVTPGKDPGCPFEIGLSFPLEEKVGVVVIDDNADALQLFERYLQGSRYTVCGTLDPEQALALVEQVVPQIVVLDVMLPGIDGWEVLGRLRAHPGTRGTPVLVCTILPQEQLALALGAAAFLRKPFSRAELLAALDQQVGRPARVSE
jgi:CheY-like chemotaxis protein